MPWFYLFLVNKKRESNVLLHEEFAGCNTAIYFICVYLQCLVKRLRAIQVWSEAWPCYTGTDLHECCMLYGCSIKIYVDKQRI